MNESKNVFILEVQRVTVSWDGSICWYGTGRHLWGISNMLCFGLGDGFYFYILCCKLMKFHNKQRLKIHPPSNADSAYMIEKQKR